MTFLEIENAGDCEGIVGEKLQGEEFVSEVLI